MIKFVVQFLIMYFFWKGNAKAKGTIWAPSSFLIGIYLLSSACAIGTLYWGDYSAPYQSECWFSMAEFLLFIFLLLIPFRQFNEISSPIIKLPSIGVLNAFSTVLIIISLYSIAYYSQYVINIFSDGNLRAARNQIYGGEEFVEASIFTTIASVSSSMYVFVLLMFFVYTVIGQNKKRRFLLLFASLSEPIHIMTFVGRDGVVFWIFSFIFLFLFFVPYMDDITISKVKRTFIYGASLLLIPFLLISMSRFENSDDGMGYSILSYMGQSFINGPLFFGIDDANKPFSDGRAFPLFLRLIGKTPPVGERMFYEINEWRSWGFGTLLVALYRNLHLIGLIILCVVAYIVFMLCLKGKEHKLCFSSLFIYLLYFQVLAEGVFYFKHSGEGGNLFILMCFFLYFTFGFLETTPTPVILQRKRGA